MVTHFRLKRGILFPEATPSALRLLTCVCLMVVIHKTNQQKKEKREQQVNGAVRTETGGLWESQRLLPVTTVRGRDGGRRGGESGRVDEVKG